MHSKKAIYNTIFEKTYSFSLLQAKYIPIKKVPTGIIYLINPIIPPSTGLNVSPKKPDFVYIKTASKILATIIPITVISIEFTFLTSFL